MLKQHRVPSGRSPARQLASWDKQPLARVDDEYSEYHYLSQVLESVGEAKGLLTLLLARVGRLHELCLRQSTRSAIATALDYRGLVQLRRP